MENPSVKYGLLGAGVLIVFYLLLWVLDPMYYFKFGLLSFFITVYFLYLAVKEERIFGDGFISFAGAFKTSFITVVIMSAITLVFGILLFKVIDPGLSDVQKQFSIEFTQWWLNTLGAGEMAEEVLDQIEEQDHSISVGRMIFGYFTGLIWWAIVSAIVALIMKRKDPSLNEFE